MGTKESNLEKFINLWENFEYEIKNSKKLQSNTLLGFAKYYEKYANDSSESADASKIYDKLKKWKKRKDKFKDIRENTLLQLEEYYKFIKKDYFTQELLEDESYEHWFD